MRADGSFIETETIDETEPRKAVSLLKPGLRNHRCLRGAFAAFASSASIFHIPCTNASRPRHPVFLGSHSSLQRQMSITSWDISKSIQSHHILRKVAFGSFEHSQIDFIRAPLIFGPLSPVVPSSRPSIPRQPLEERGV